MAIEKINETTFVIHQGVFMEAISKHDLILKIKNRGHPIDDQLIAIVENMKVGDKTIEPQAFYGDVPSVNGVPKK